MIILDTSKCPISLIYDRGYELIKPISNGIPVYERRPEKDIFKIDCKKSSLIIKPFTHKIQIKGNIKELALNIALLIQGTLESLKDDNDIINEAFLISKDGKIKKCRWNIYNIHQVNKLIVEYNRVYTTALLLK